MKRILFLALPVFLSGLVLFTTFSDLGAANAQSLAVRTESATTFGTGFSYQGRLTQNGSQYTGTCDFNFSLWDALNAGSQVGAGTNRTNVPVTDGLFSVTLNQAGIFGVDAFDGSPRWLEIAVRCPAGAGGSTTLSPRQEILPAPYAIYAGGTEWGGIQNIPADIADGDDQDLILNSSTLSLTGSNQSVEIGYAWRSRPPVTNISNTVDSAGWQNTSITIGSDGFPIISYYDAVNTALKTAHCNDLACTNASINIVDNFGSVGQYSSIIIGADGLPVISYHDAVGDLKAAYCLDRACTSVISNTLDGGGQYTSIAIGADGFPIISHYDHINGDLQVSHCDDMACTKVTNNNVHTTGDTGLYTSIAIGADGLPVISYYRPTGLLFAHCDDLVCSIATLSSIANIWDFGQYSSITIGADGLPIISYFRYDNSTPRGYLSVTHCENLACTSYSNFNIDVVGPGTVVGSHTSITIGNEGLPVISYYDETNEVLKIAHCSNLECSSAIINTLDPTAKVGQFTAITIGIDGFPVISYIDFSLDKLKIAHCGSALCIPFFRRR